jgi:uncharacterized iron-regulated membrane protein
VRRALVRIHRWISLGFACLWLVQAVTGAFIVYYWEMEDATVPGAHRPVDLAAIERRVDALAPAGGPWRPVSLRVTAGWTDRYDLKLAGPDSAEVNYRLAGDGTVLRIRDANERSVIGTIVILHRRLLAGEVGEWIIGISGIVLLTNLAVALQVSWPRSGWRRALTPVRRAPPAAKTYSWHRALGLWFVIPAFVLVGAGTLLRFEDSVAKAIGAAVPTVDAIAATPGTAPLRLTQVIATAEATIPGSRMSSVAWPTAKDATWRLRLLEPGEIRRAFGTSRVFVDGNTGAVRGVFPASTDTMANSFRNGIYAFHTGEAGGPLGRVLVLLIGLWLATMVVLGVQLWWRRR